MSKKDDIPLVNELNDAFFKVEDTIEEFILLRIPTLPHTAKIEVKKLWDNKYDKKQFYRINYWRHNKENNNLECFNSIFGSVTEVNEREKIFTDETKNEI